METEARVPGRKSIGALPRLDCAMCRVFFLVLGLGILAFIAGWPVAGEAISLFGLLTLWLAAQLAAAPCCDDETDNW